MVEHYLWIFSIMFMACFLQGITGFGSVLVALPLLVMVLEIKTVIPFIVLTATTMNLVLLVQLRRFVRWDRVRPLLIGALPGVVLGSFFLSRVDENGLRLALGGVLILYAVYGVFSRPSPRGVPETWAYILGFLAGGLGGAFGIAGPPLVAYVSMQPWDKHEVKAFLQAVFVLSGIAMLASYAFMGLITRPVLTYFALSLPVLFLGWWAGSFMYGRISETLYRKAVLVLLGCMGVAMVWQSGFLT